MSARGDGATRDAYLRIRDAIEDVGAELQLSQPAIERIIGGALGALKRELVALDGRREQMSLPGVEG